MADTAELRTIKKCVTELTRALASPDNDLIHFLHGNGFIEDMWDMIMPSQSGADNRAYKLVRRIEERVRFNPQSYHSLVRYLERGCNKSLLSTLKREFEQQKQVQQGASSSGWQRYCPSKGTKRQYDYGNYQGLPEDQGNANHKREGPADSEVEMTDGEEEGIYTIIYPPSKRPRTTSSSHEITIAKKEEEDQATTFSGADTDSNSSKGGISSHKINEDLEQQLEEYVYHMATSYASYSFAISKSLEEKGVSVQEVLSYILSLPTFKYDDGSEKIKLLSRKRVKLQRAQSISEIFITLNCEFCNFLDFYVLKKLMKKFQVRLSEQDMLYPEKHQKYIETIKIMEFRRIQCILTAPSGETKRMTLTLALKSSSRLSQVYNITKAVAHILSLKRSAIRVHKFKRHGVVTCYLQNAVADILFCEDTSFSEEQEEEFRRHSVKKLECNGYTYTFSPSPKDFEKHTTIQESVSQCIPACISCHYATQNPEIASCLCDWKQHVDAYKKAIREKIAIDVQFIKFNLIGLPRSGKTTFWRRMEGKVFNFLEEKKEYLTTCAAMCKADAGAQPVLQNVTTSPGVKYHPKHWREEIYQVLYWAALRGSFATEFPPLLKPSRSYKSTQGFLSPTSL